jgi:hypothetical protein
MNYLLAAAEITNPLIPNYGEGTVFFSKLIQSLIGLAFVVAVIIFIFIVLVGAIQWITSGGDKGAVQSAQGKITNAIIGLVILLASYAIVKIIGDFFGISALQNFTIDIGPLIIK